MGKTGRGTHEHHNVMGRIDIITGTLGKALGGASGGYTSGMSGGQPAGEGTDANAPGNVVNPVNLLRGLFGR